MQKLDLLPCKAPFWADNGHSQTLWAHFLRSPELKNLGQQFEVDLADGDRLFCFYLAGTSDYVVSHFHGLSGDVQSDYMQRTAMVAQRLGHTVVLVNHRGAGIGAPYAKKPYHSGCAQDISRVLEKLREMFPGKKQISAGYSLSGNIMLCLLGGFANGAKPDGAITVNAPLNLEMGSRLLKTGLNRLYDMRFVSRLRKMVQEKHTLGLIEKPYDIPALATLWDMDEIYTAPASGFRDRSDYYQTCSSMHYVNKIDVPTYVLSSMDDPFVAAENYIKAPFSKYTQLHLEKRGGHMGYLMAGKNPWESQRWLDHYMETALKGLVTTLS